MSFGSPGSAYIALTDLPTTTQQANAISEEVKYTHKRPPAIHPARWWTLEFFIYYALLAFSVITGVRSAIQFSSENHPNYGEYAYKLSAGWLFGRQIDNSDAQYRGFRNRLPLATAAFLAFILFQQAVLRVMRRKGVGPRPQFAFRACLNLLGMIGLHGFNAIKIAVILAGSYGLGKATAGRRWAPICTWAYALFVLFCLETCTWRWAWICRWLAPLDNWTGLVLRWDITFNLTVLRLISFNMDWHWQRDPAQQLAAVQHQSGGCEACKAGDCPRFRTMCSPDASEYNVLSFLAYTLYLPLYLAGPLVSFNDFYSQTERPTPRTRPSYVSVYILRWLGSLLLFEFFLHYMWVVAIKDASAWRGFTPTQFVALGIMNLYAVWLKLLIIWRFFRALALLDGIDAPENMERCIANNWSGFGFWRAWHRSFNLWIVRYMYIPLGGSKTASWNVWPIFTFVALWHDFELKMILWGWLIALFLIPEQAAGWWQRRVDLEAKYPRAYRHICAVGGSLTLLQVTACNLLGFVLGIDGMREMLGRVLSWRQLPFLAILLICYFAIVQFAFEVREEEHRRGIFKNY